MKTARPLTERNTGRLKGYLLGIIAAASYGTNPLFALPLYQAGMSPDGVLFLRYMMALPVLALMIVLRGQTFRITWRQCLILVIMGMLVAVSSLTLFCSYNYMDVGIASTILFVYPIMVAVIMAAVFHEHISPVTILCIGIATAGIAMLMKAPDGSMVSLAGVVLAVLSALTYAVYIVAVNKTSLVRVATLTITFYVLLFGVSLFAVRLQMAGGPLIPHLPDWRRGTCDLPYRNLVRLHKRRDPDHRLHPDCHPGGFRTRNRRYHRHCSLRRNPDPAVADRTRPDCNGGYPGNCRPGHP